MNLINEMAVKNSCRLDVDAACSLRRGNDHERL